VDYAVQHHRQEFMGWSFLHLTGICGVSSALSDVQGGTEEIFSSFWRGVLKGKFYFFVEPAM
jgi:hypothetical protein